MIKKTAVLLILLLLWASYPATAASKERNIHSRISVLLRDGSVITTPDLQGAVTDSDGLFTTLNPYIQVKSLSIDALVFYQNTQKIIFDWEQIINNLHSIELLSPELDSYRHGAMLITPKKGKKIRTADATLLQYIGHDQPTRQITILEYDSYNKWWREAYLDIQKVKKIVLGSDELLKPAPPPPPSRKASRKDGFETTADGISRRLKAAAPDQGVNLNIERGYALDS